MLFNFALAETVLFSYYKCIYGCKESILKAYPYVGHITRGTSKTFLGDPSDCGLLCTSPFHTTKSISKEGLE